MLALGQKFCLHPLNHHCAQIRGEEQGMTLPTHSLVNLLFKFAVVEIHDIIFLIFISTSDVVCLPFVHRPVNYLTTKLQSQLQNCYLFILYKSKDGTQRWASCNKSIFLCFLLWSQGKNKIPKCSTFVGRYLTLASKLEIYKHSKTIKS